MNVGPHNGLSSRHTDVHANIEAIYLAFFDPFVSVIVCKSVGSAQEMCVVLFGYKEFVSWDAWISVIENKSEIRFHHRRVVAEPYAVLNPVNWFVGFLVDRFFRWHLFL